MSTTLTLRNSSIIPTGVLAFVLDTGIRWGHEEFKNDPETESRVICGFDAFNWFDQPGDWNNGCYDGVGHGTHVAAIIGGSFYVSSCLRYCV
jgi:subtilisin family serine protease